MHELKAMIVKLDLFITIITLKSQAKNFSSILRVVMATIFLYLASTDHAHAQTTVMMSYCNLNDDATNLPAFYDNLNASFADIRASLRSSTSLFATAERVRSSEPIYALFQCRPYLSYSDCLSCFDEAADLARRTCTITRGVTTLSDSCFLRYDYSNHFKDVLNLGQTGFCDDPDRSLETVLNETFYETVKNAFMEVVDIVPREDKLFVLGRKAGDGGATAVFVAGQCVPTIEREQCSSCLESAERNVDGCMPAGGGRAVQYGCFLRFSASPFFNRSQAVDLNQVARSGKYFY